MPRLILFIHTTQPDQRCLMKRSQMRICFCSSSIIMCWNTENNKMKLEKVTHVLNVQVFQIYCSTECSSLVKKWFVVTVDCRSRCEWGILSSYISDCFFQESRAYLSFSPANIDHVSLDSKSQLASVSLPFCHSET